VEEEGGPFHGAYRAARRKAIGGKLAFSCSGPELVVFSSAVRKRPNKIATCPKPDRSVPRRVRRKAMIVCSYGARP
jgi:hypothetical protein